MASLLVTGFEAFGVHETNPSAAVVSLLTGAPRPGAAAPAGSNDPPHRISGLVLPVAFQTCWEPLLCKVEEVHPDAVLALGLAEDRSDLTPELVAINYMEARIPDNRGWQPTQTPIEAEGPAAYFSTLPVHRMTARLADAGFPASLSYSAGAFVCNYVMYRLLHYASTVNPRVRCGFMHLPGAGAATSLLSPERLAQAVRIASDAIFD
ncbi:MAG: pyroglutamyl-peptidase I [bacterium]